MFLVAQLKGGVRSNDVIEISSRAEEECHIDVIQGSFVGYVTFHCFYISIVRFPPKKGVRPQRLRGGFRPHGDAGEGRGSRTRVRVVAPAP